MTRWLGPAQGTVILLVLACTHASAQEDEVDALKFGVSQSFRYDSNLFRRNTDVRSETLSTTTAKVAIDKRYSLQRIEIGASMVANRYRSNDYLDFNALNYRAVWHWSLTPRLQGTLSRSRSEDINTFDYYRNFDRNLRTDNTTAGAAEFTVGRDWRLLGQIEEEHRVNERPTAQQGDYKLRNIVVGVRRLFPSGSNISYRLLDGRGDYYNRIPGVGLSPTAFNQIEHEVQLSWSVTAKTRVTGTVAYVRREHPGFSVRDFSGVRGNIVGQWAATGKLGMQVRLNRDISAYQTNTSSYTTSTGLSVSPYWAIGAHTTVFAGLTYARQTYGGPLPGIVADNQEDRNTSALLAIRWQPINALTLDAGLSRERRSSNLEAYSYTNSSARLDAKFAF